MGLKLRANAGEGVIRSVGSPPNGILAIGHPGEGAGEPCWIIDPNWTPSGASRMALAGLQAAEGGGVLAEMGEHAEGANPAAARITVAELVNAITDQDTAEGIWFYVRALPGVSAQANAEAGYFEIILKDVEFAIETREALKRRGFLRPGSLPGLP